MIAETKNTVEAFKPGEVQAEDYTPASWFGSYWFTARKPLFRLIWVRLMLEDYRIRFGLWLLKGPIVSNMGVQIHCDNPAAAEFIKETIDRFWADSSIKALRSIEWGYSGAEAVYSLKDDLVQFDFLKPFHAQDCRVLTRDGRKVGVVVRRIRGLKTDRQYLMGPKGFWHVHMREEQPWYGVSRLKFCFPHWFDKYRTSGSYDSLSLFFYKYALSGTRVYFPPHMRKNSDGTIENPRDIADKLANDTRNGATLVIPNERDSDGNRKWEVEDATNPASGSELMEYQSLLDNFIFQGLGIPSELIEAGASGSGYAGRRVPAQAFYSMLQEMANSLLWDFDQQILKPLVALNFGADVTYELVTTSLLEAGGEGEGQQQQQGQSGGGLSTATLRGASGSAVLAPRENPHQ